MQPCLPLRWPTYSAKYPPADQRSLISISIESYSTGPEKRSPDRVKLALDRIAAKRQDKVQIGLCAYTTVELKEVLGQVPELHKRFIYYLESQGYIHPAKLRRQRISRRDYSPDDLRIIRDMWRYYRRGYSVQTAYDLVNRTERITSFVTLSVPEEKWPHLLSSLREQPEVVEASNVYGTNLDIIIRLETPEEGEVYQALLPALRSVELVGAPTVLRVVNSWQRENCQKKEDADMLAYVLMRVPGKDASEVMERLHDFPSIAEAATVYGETDIIARVEVSDQRELDELVMTQLHSIPAVESTRTFIVIGGLHWRRNHTS